MAATRDINLIVITYAVNAAHKQIDRRRRHFEELKELMSNERAR